jgi:hypothetical protein
MASMRVSSWAARSAVLTVEMLVSYLVDASAGKKVHEKVEGLVVLMADNSEISLVEKKAGLMVEL